ncbi:MAG: hypothetical protein ACXWXL_03275 [Candidatus Binatia bacterium]
MEEQKELEIPDGSYSTRGGNSRFGVDGKSSPPKSKRLTPYQWGELLGLLKSGHYTQVDLAARYGVSVNAIINKRKKLKVGIGDDVKEINALENINKTAEALTKAIGISTEEAGELITAARRKTLKRIESVGNVASKLYVDAAKKHDKDPTCGALGAIKDDIKALLDIQALYEREIRLSGLCLGFKDGEFGEADNNIPILTVLKMSDEDIERVQKELREGGDKDDDLDDPEDIEPEDEGDFE